MSAVQLQDLNPADSVISLRGQEYEIRKFDLLARSWAYSEFQTEEEPNGLLVLSKRMAKIEEDFEPLLRCVWHLLKRKRDFKDYKDFVLAVGEGDDSNSTMMKMGELLRAFNRTMGISELKEDEIKEDLELKKQ